MNNIDAVKHILINDQGYTDNQAELLIRDINPLQDCLSETLSKWLFDRTIINYEIDGLFLKHLMRGDDKNFIGSLGLLNKLLDTKTVSAADRQKWINHLKTSTNIIFAVDS